MAKERKEFTSSKKPGKAQETRLLTVRFGEEQAEGIITNRPKLDSKSLPSGEGQWYGDGVVDPNC